MLELIGQKVGMSHLYDDEGTASPMTLIKLYDNCVVDFDSNEEGYNRVTVAFEKAEAKKLNKAQIGHFGKKSVALHKKIKESRVKKSIEYKTNDSIAIDSVLNEGDLIAITGVSSGKGFAGAMKRHGFGGLEASHGISISHRSHGSTGQCQDPGKVFKGKKMAGHMGADKVTTKNLRVLVIDKDKSVIGVKGAVPGHAGNDVIVRIAKI